METELNYADPKAVLLAFFEEMNRWDIEFFPLLYDNRKNATTAEREELDNRVLERLKCIFEKYCTPKDRSKQGRQNWIGVANPPTYDRATQTIVEINYELPRRAAIDTIDRVRDYRYRYVLLKKGERWLIDHKKWILRDGKIEKDFL